MLSVLPDFVNTDETSIICTSLVSPILISPELENKENKSSLKGNFPEDYADINSETLRNID